MYNHRDEGDFYEKYVQPSEESEDQTASHYHYQLKKEEVEMRVNEINIKLEHLCDERLGDLDSNSPRSHEKTLRLVETLISQIKKAQEAKNGIASELRQIQAVNFNNTSVLEKTAKEKKQLEADKERLVQKIKDTEKYHREVLEKVQAEKEEALRQVRQIQGREKTFETQIRKKELREKNLLEQIRKFQTEKPQYKNSFEVMQKFEDGPILLNFGTNAENQYGQLAAETIEASHQKIINENKYMKECLTNMYRELNSVLEIKKELMKHRRGYEDYEYQYEMNDFKPETLNLPEQFSRDRLRELNENLQKFKEAMKVGELADSRLEDRKDSCIGGLKSVFRNYKQIIESQDNLLNKVVLKSKEFKAAEMSQIENRYARMNETNELERAKKFVEEQAQYLSTKNTELEKTRKMMQTAMKKAEENKREMLKQKQEFEQEALTMRRSIEVLPSMIERELSRQ